METCGAFDLGAKRLLKRVCNIMHDDDTDLADYAYKHVLKRCSVAIQKGNARVIMKRLQEDALFMGLISLLTYYSFTYGHNKLVGLFVVF